MRLDSFQALFIYLFLPGFLDNNAALLNSFCMCIYTVAWPGEVAEAQY